MIVKKVICERKEVDWDDVDAVYVIATLQQMVEKYGNVVIDYNYHGHDGNFDINLSWKREETDEEYTRRIHAEQKIAEKKKKDREAKEIKERKEYERLKAKFGE